MYIDELASFAQQLRLGAVPERVRERAKLVVLDTCGAVIAGGCDPAMAKLAGWAQREDHPFLRALAAGAAGVALELDEGSIAARGHPGIHVIPAALERAASCEASGARTLEAVIAGYEVCARLGAATRFRPGIHPHGTWGACGAAAATGALDRVDAATLGQGLRIAAALCFATSYRAVRDGATVRNLWTGGANLMGMLAIETARMGFTGPEDAPRDVFGETLGADFSPEVASEGLGSRWYLDGSYFKRYACCRHGHPAVDALRSLVEDNAVQPDDIAWITVHTYAQAVAAMGASEFPLSPLAAKFSLPYVLAAYLETGSLDHDVFLPPHLDSSALRESARKVEVREDPGYTAKMPDSSPARVTVRLASGAERTAQVMAARGDPGDPGLREALQRKFLDLTSPFLGDEAAGAMMDEVLSVEQLAGVGSIARALGDSRGRRAPLAGGPPG